MLNIIKEVSVEAVKQTDPIKIVFGKVESTNPLKINVEQKLILEKEHLILTSIVKDMEVEVSSQFFTENSKNTKEVHNHEVKGKKKIKIHLNLKTGENVMLLSMQGGQKYIILDRIKGEK